MKLIFKSASGHKVLFPKVGEWESGEIKDVDFDTAQFLLKNHGEFIKEHGKKLSPIPKLEIDIKPKLLHQKKKTTRKPFPFVGSYDNTTSKKGGEK